MKLARSFLATNLFFLLVFVSFLSLVTVQNISAQDSKVALQRGYRTGYSDGYMAGYRDSIGNAEKSLVRHTAYAKANRAYNQDYGKLEDYRDGYQQGFEIGYEAGFEKRSFDAALPENLTLRGVIDPGKKTTTPAAANDTSGKAVIEPVAEDTKSTVSQQSTDNVTYQPRVADQTAVPPTGSTDTAVTTEDGQAAQPAQTEKISYEPTAQVSDDIIVIPKDTELIIELFDEITTERAREGDSFKARVVSPTEIAGAIIEGRVVKIQKPGRLKRRSEMLLSFDRIILTDSRWSNFNAIVTEVLPVKGDNVKRVDVEGTVEGKRRNKTDAAKIGASTGTGMVVGGLIGGPVGVAVGAGVGAAFGVGAVVVERGKHIKLLSNQQLRIRTNYETQIR